MLNGKLNPENDNFTSISIRGETLVDYIVTPHVDLKTCLEFNIYTLSVLIERGGYEGIKLIDDCSRLPDHSVLCLRFQAGELFSNHYRGDPQQQVKIRNRNVPFNYLSSEMCHNAFLEVIDQLENGQKTQDNVDHCYQRLRDLMYKQMDKYCGVNKDVVKNNYKTKQLYWNNKINE